MPETTLHTPVKPAEAYILVVEDNMKNYMLVARMLSFMGVINCHWKTSGWQVAQFAETLPRLDLILLDINLPHEDGYTVLSKLRQNDKLHRTIIVAVTADAGEEQMRKARAAGFDGFMGKPLDPDRFPDQIRRLLAGEPVWEWA
jgi:two-component system cell cycle response regulator DivK